MRELLGIAGGFALILGMFVALPVLAALVLSEFVGMQAAGVLVMLAFIGGVLYTTNRKANRR